jgi:hypothetical protein
VIEFESPKSGTPVRRIAKTASAGSLSGGGSGAVFTAPSSGAGAAVTIKVRHAESSIDFSVLEPTGVEHAAFAEYWTYGSTTQAGAGVHLNVSLEPTSVSFGAVRIFR